VDPSNNLCGARSATAMRAMQKRKNQRGFQRLWLESGARIA
jgi:hypothetical protein